MFLLLFLGGEEHSQPRLGGRGLAARRTRRHPGPVRAFGTIPAHKAFLEDRFVVHPGMDLEPSERIELALPTTRPPHPGWATLGPHLGKEFGGVRPDAPLQLLHAARVEVHVRRHVVHVPWKGKEETLRGENVESWVEDAVQSCTLQTEPDGTKRRRRQRRGGKEEGERRYCRANTTVVDVGWSGG